MELITKNRSNINKIFLIINLVIFFSISVLIALNLKPGIIPDEEAHFAFAKHFSSTWSIPPDTYKTFSWGWYIEQNPFLYHWLNGRCINFIKLASPKISEINLLIALRLINSFYALGTVYFCFLFSKEIIKSLFWQLLPTFLISNTLMFVFLSGGLNYDNLAIFLSTASLYFLFMALQGKAFLKYSLLWMIFISLGTLVKFTILPLALITFIIWLVFLFRKGWKFFNFKNIKFEIILVIILLPLLINNFLIYGVNLIQYQTITPPCREILTDSQCRLSPFENRYRNNALESKMTIIESIELDYPNPLEYTIFTWTRNMLKTIFGVLGHQTYFPLHNLLFFQFLFYWSCIQGLITFSTRKNISYLTISLVLITIFYSIVLLIKNYDTELIYGFWHFALQGRYIFPVIAPIYILFAKILQATPSKYLRWAILIFTIGLFIYGGPLTFILKWDSVFSSWFF
jgi:hypothetical protein